MNPEASSGLAQFVRLGFRDAEARLLRRLPPPVIDDPRVVATVSSSVVVRALSWVLDRSIAAIESSAAAGRYRSLAASWLAAHWAVRRRGVGLLLLVAVSVHVLLVWTQTDQIGWFWLIVPGMVAIVGLVLLSTGVSPRAER
jgi:hypothetical protein